MKDHRISGCKLFKGRSFLYLCIVIINNKVIKTHLKWVTQHTLPRYPASPTGSDTTLLPLQEKEKIPPRPVTAQLMGRALTPPIKSRYTLNSQFTPLDSSFTIAPPKSRKELPLLCFSGLLCCSPLHWMPWIAILYCSLVNPFCWKNIWLAIC